jgi:hypothetical protein
MFCKELKIRYPGIKLNQDLTGRYQRCQIYQQKRIMNIVGYDKGLARWQESLGWIFVTG